MIFNYIIHFKKIYLIFFFFRNFQTYKVVIDCVQEYHELGKYF